MLTVTLSAFACSGMEEQIRNAIRVIPGGENVVVEVKVSADGGDDQVVVRGFNGSADEIAGTLYNRLVMRAHVLSIEDEDSSEDEGLPATANPEPSWEDQPVAWSVAWPDEFPTKTHSED